MMTLATTNGEAAARYREHPNFTDFIKFQGMMYDAFRNLVAYKYDPTGKSELLGHCGMPKLQYTLELNTVFMNLPRQVGKTATLLGIANRHGEDVILIFHRHEMIKYVRQNFGIAPNDERIRIVSAENVAHGTTFRGRYNPAKYYLFDEPGHIRKDTFTRAGDVLMEAHNWSENGDPKFFGLGTGGFF